jgi:hypothetical protein
MPYGMPRVPGVTYAPDPLTQPDPLAEAANINAAQGVAYAQAGAPGLPAAPQAAVPPPPPAPPSPAPPPAPPPGRSPYVEMATAAAKRYGLDVDTFLRQINQESGFNPNAVNPRSGAAGIAQFMPATARELGINPLDPAQALDAAARYLRQQLDAFGQDQRAALAAYNAGPGTVQRLRAQYGDQWEAHLPAETTGYLNAIASAVGEATGRVATAVQGATPKGLPSSAVARATATRGTGRLRAADVEPDPGKAAVLQAYVDALLNDTDANNLLLQYQRDRETAGPYKALHMFVGSFKDTYGNAVPVGPLAQSPTDYAKTHALAFAGGLAFGGPAGALASLAVQDIGAPATQALLPKGTPEALRHGLEFAEYGVAGGGGLKASLLFGLLAGAGGEATGRAGLGRTVGEIVTPFLPSAAVVGRNLLRTGARALTPEEEARIAAFARKAQGEAEGTTPGTPRAPRRTGDEGLPDPKAFWERITRAEMFLADRIDEGLSWTPRKVNWSTYPWPTATERLRALEEAERLLQEDYQRNAGRASELLQIAEGPPLKEQRRILAERRRAGLRGPPSADAADTLPVRGGPRTGRPEYTVAETPRTGFAARETPGPGEGYSAETPPQVGDWVETSQGQRGRVTAPLDLEGQVRVRLTDGSDVRVPATDLQPSTDPNAPLPGQTGLFGAEFGAELPPAQEAPTGQPVPPPAPHEFRGEQGGLQARAFSLEEAPPRPGFQSTLEDALVVPRPPAEETAAPQTRPAAQEPPAQEPPGAAPPIQQQRVIVKASDLEYRPDLFQTRDAEPGLPYSERRVRQIVQDWDPAQFTTPTVVPDPENPGKYIVTMGQHRTEAFRRVYGPDAPLEVNVSQHDIRDPSQLARAQLEADQSNATTKPLNVREEIRNLKRAAAMGETPEQIAGRLGKSASYVDKLIDIARLGPNAADAVVNEPALFDYAAEAGRGMRVYGISQEDANGLFERIRSAAKGSRPTVTALRETIDKFGKALAETAQNPLFDIGRLPGTQTGLLGLMAEYAAVQAKLKSAINAAARAQKTVRALGESETASAADRQAAQRLAALGKAEEERLRAELKATEDDVLRALKGDLTPRKRPEHVPPPETPGPPEQGQAPPPETPGPPERLLPPGPPTVPDPDLENLIAAIEDAGAVRPDLLERRSVELRRRVAKAEQLRKDLINQGVSPLEAQQQSRAALRGRLADPFFQTDANFDLDMLGHRIDATAQYVPYFTRNAAHNGLDKLNLGIIPAPHEVAALGQIFGPRLQYAIQELGEVWKVQTRVQGFLKTALPSITLPSYDAIGAAELAEALRAGAPDAPAERLQKVAQRMLDAGDVEVVLRRDGKAGITLSGRQRDALSRAVEGEFREFSEPVGVPDYGVPAQTLPPESPTLAGDLQSSLQRAEPIPAQSPQDEIAQRLQAEALGFRGQAEAAARERAKGAPSLGTKPLHGGAAGVEPVPEQALPPEQFNLAGEGQPSLASAPVIGEGPSPPTPRRSANEPQAAREALDRARQEARDNAARKATGNWTPDKGPLLDAVAKVLIQIPAIPKQLLTSLDRGQVLRQGGVLIRHGQQVTDALRKTMLIAEDAADAARLRQRLHLPERWQIPTAQDVMEQIHGSRWAETRKAAGLAEEEWGPGARLSLRNEQFMSDLVRRLVPGAAMSERSYVVYLNKLRADVFDAVVEKWLRDGRSFAANAEHPITARDLADLADYLNIATGRGSLGDLERAAQKLSYLWFAPRNVVSRFQLVAKVFDPRTSGLVRREMAKDLAVYVGGGMMLLALADLSGLADVEIDPRSTDFGKMRIGPTRIDFWGGYSQIARLVAQLYTGQVKTSTGQVLPADRSAIVLRYLQSKLAPSTGLATQVLDDRDLTGRRFDLASWETLKNIAVPLFIQDTIDAVREQGILGFATAPLAFFGVGVQSYVTPAEARQQARDTVSRERFGVPYEQLTDKFPESGFSRQAEVDADPRVAPLIQKAREAYAGTGFGRQQAIRDQRKAELDAQQEQAEKAWEQGTLSKPLPEIWSDLNRDRASARRDFELAFGDNFRKDEFDKALQGYYDQQQKHEDGTIDWDATTLAQERYLAGLPEKQRLQLEDFLGVQELKKSPRYQEYRAELQHRVDLGYYAPNVTQAQRTAIQEAHPEVDVSLWKWYGGVKDDPNPPVLNTPAAVDQALALGLPNRPVKLAGFGRPINESEASRRAWDYSKRAIDAFENQLVPRFGDQEAQRLYRKPYAQLTKDQQAAVATNLRTQARKDTPELDAWLMWWGETETLHSQAAVAILANIIKTYGNKPPRPDWNPRLAQDAR